MRPIDDEKNPEDRKPGNRLGHGFRGSSRNQWTNYKDGPGALHDIPRPTRKRNSKKRSDIGKKHKKRLPDDDVAGILISQHIEDNRPDEGISQFPTFDEALVDMLRTLEDIAYYERRERDKPKFLMRKKRCKAEYSAKRYGKVQEYRNSLIPATGLCPLCHVAKKGKQWTIVVVNGNDTTICRTCYNRCLIDIHKRDLATTKQWLSEHTLQDINLVLIATGLRMVEELKGRLT